jgi:hypothetical protein
MASAALSRFAADVALCTGGEPLDAALRAKLEPNGVTVRCEAIARLEVTGARLEQIAFEGGRPLAPDAVFVVNVPRQRPDPTGRLGCTSFAGGCVEVNEFGQTSVPGGYAADDVALRATVPVPLSAVIAAARAPSPARHRPGFALCRFRPADDQVFVLVVNPSCALPCTTGMFTTTFQVVTVEGFLAGSCGWSSTSGSLVGAALCTC